jgi:hypothetical protein
LLAIISDVNLFIDILALRSADPKPSDPVQHLRDYFGEVRDPMWDEVDRLTSENADIRDV